MSKVSHRFQLIWFHNLIVSTYVIYIQDCIHIALDLILDGFHLEEHSSCKKFLFQSVIDI